MDLEIELGSLPLFADLTPDQIAWLSGHCEEVAIAPGEALIEEGRKGESFYVLIEGELEVARQAAGQEIRLATLDTAGDFVGEISLLSGNAPIATVRGNRPSRLIRFTVEAFQEMLGVCPPVVFQFIQATARRLKYNEGLTQQQEKLAGLGKISAGLAHDLNNPAAAALRAAKTLAETLESLKMQTVALARTPLDPGHLERLSAVIREDSGDPLRESELEDEISDWLDDRDVADGWRLAPTFAQAGLSVERLEGLAEGVPGEALPAAIAWLERSIAASVLVREVEMAAGRIHELVSAVKSYSFMDQGPRQEVDIHRGLEDTLIILGHKLGDEKVQVERDYAPDLSPIEAYGVELNQVWTNLIDNAIDAAGPGGRIRLRTSQEARSVTVEIADNGPGVPEEIQPKIFEPFFTTKDVGKGTGLGLHIVHRIVYETHKGDITLDSGPGETRFRVRLPISMDEASPDPEPHP
jgi:signal transduction histidine kinase